MANSRQTALTLPARAAFNPLGAAWHADLPAPGRYWIFVYEGGGKVAEVAYEVVGAE